MFRVAASQYRSVGLHHQLNSEDIAVMGQIYVHDNVRLKAKATSLGYLLNKIVRKGSDVLVLQDEEGIACQVCPPDGLRPYRTALRTLKSALPASTRIDTEDRQVFIEMPTLAGEAFLMTLGKKHLPRRKPSSNAKPRSPRL